jgi:glycosyltransferase involved in cell wall biosynthesis
MSFRKIPWWAIQPGAQTVYKGKRVAVVMPAYNEESFIARVLTTIPSFVDQIYAVNDGSTDHTLEIAQTIARQNSHITVINRKERGGVGAAITTGHVKALADGMDVIAVMAGDGEMDPALLEKLLEPVAEGRADYAKGDRFSIAGHKNGISAWRIFGIFLLTYLTRIASGYWHVSDPQHGYTAISKQILGKLPLDKLYKGYAFENDMLVNLNVIGARVLDIPMPMPASAATSKKYSKIRYPSFIVKTSWLLFKDFVWRIWVKYMKRPFDKVLAVGEKAENKSGQIS